MAFASGFVCVPDFPKGEPVSRLLKIPAAAAELSISRSLLYEMLASGELRSVTVGTRGVRIPDTELDRFVAQRLARKASDDAS